MVIAYYPIVMNQQYWKTTPEILRTEHYIVHAKCKENPALLFPTTPPQEFLNLPQPLIIDPGRQGVVKQNVWLGRVGVKMN